MTKVVTASQYKYSLSCPRLLELLLTIGWHIVSVLVSVRIFFFMHVADLIHLFV